MEKFLADTHAIIWYVENDSRLGADAKSVLDKMGDGSAQIFISIMSLLEMDYLISKGKISSHLPEALLKECRSPRSALQIADINIPIYRCFEKVPATTIPELPDRIIAATALHLSCPILTVDSKITKWKKIETIW